MGPVGQAAIAGAIASIVGISELLARYRSDPKQALLTPAALVYVLLNAASGFGALYLVRAFGWNFGQHSHVGVWRVLVAGFGSLSLFRSSLFVAKVGGSNVGVGPNVVLEALLGAFDRDVDRKCADGISKRVAAMKLDTLNAASVMSTLPVICLALMQNFPPGDQALLAADLSRVVNEKDLTDEAKMRALIIQLAKYLSVELVDRVVQDIEPLLRQAPVTQREEVLEGLKKEVQGEGL